MKQYHKDRDGTVHEVTNVVQWNRSAETRCGRGVGEETVYEMRGSTPEFVTCKRCQELAPGGP